MLTCSNVLKTYDSKVAVDHISLNVPRGIICGILGPNGAGKSSLLRMITGITVPDEGKILLNGAPASITRTSEFGYMPEERGLYKKLKVGEQIEYFLQLKGLSVQEARNRCVRWLHDLELSEWKDRKVSELSKGMAQKVQFICTVAHEPDLLILDEPFSGLDPINARLIETHILAMKAMGITILFSTHRMEQVEAFCDRIILINQGKILLEENMPAIRTRFRKPWFYVRPAEVATGLNLPGEIRQEPQTDGSILVQMPEGSGMTRLMQALISSGCEVESVRAHEPRVADIFIDLVTQAEGGSHA